jgi:hypothetical protein
VAESEHVIPGITAPTRIADSKTIKTSGFLWPAVGLMVVRVPHVDICRAHTYVDNYIPAPFLARISHGVSMDDLLFKPRNLLDESHANGRILTTREHCDQFKRMRDIIDLASFMQDLKEVHRWEEEMKLVAEEEMSLRGVNTNDNQPSLGFMYTNLPLDEMKESALMDSLAKCTTEYDSVKKYQSDMMRHLSSLVNETDKFVFWPIYPRDETSIEGMQMVCHHLMTKFGLLEEKEVNEKTGEYKLHENTNHWTVLLYGDGLSLNNWGHCHMQLFTHVCQQMGRKLAKNVLDAYNQILPQKGLFHQLMHQTDRP